MPKKKVKAFVYSLCWQSLKIMDNILKGLKKQNTFYDFLKYIKKTDGLTMVQDNGWFWLEYKGKQIDNSAKERFTKSSEIDDLMKLAGI